jgi:hypothetical protein
MNDELPDDINDEENTSRSGQTESGWAAAGAGFAASSDDFDDVRYFFSRRGAYRKFKAPLARRSAIDHWHVFSGVTEQTLRDWCALHSIEIVG